MEQREKILVTSALPYANGPIHLGHLAGAYLPADIYVRYQRAMKRDVVYICGSDEHGVPITIAAERQGVSPRDIVEKYRENHRSSFEKFGMSFDNYSGTSKPKHHEISQGFFLELHRKGYLSEKTMSQFYCPHDDMFLADRYVEGTCPACKTEGARGDQCDACGRSLDPTQLINPYCVLCKKPPVLRQTSHWFINLKQFQGQIKDWLDTKTGWKDNVKNFCYGWINEGLEDRAVTRDLKWGVPVPLEGYEDKVLYVWFDAPIGYISSTVEWAEKIGQPDKWKEYWLDKNTKMVHFIGKDNIVFHAIIWPLILMGHGDYVLPAEIPANEYLTLEGSKISTSKNYAVWLDEYLEKFPPDPLRYCIAINAPENKDADFSWKDFQARNNNELADILGNFINRSLTFLERNFDGIVPPQGELDSLDRELLDKINAAPDIIGSCIEKFEVRKATTELMNLARFANKYFNDQEPWVTIKSNPGKCGTTMNLCVQISRTLAILMAPFIPFSVATLWRMLNQAGDVIKQNWNDAAIPAIAPGHRMNKLEILFPKIEDDVIDAEIEKLKNVVKANQQITQSKPKEEMEDTRIDFEDFQKVELKVARVLEAERVEKADRLLKLKIEVGDETRQIVAGVAQFYEPDELIGKTIVIASNLKPAKIRGIESNGMLLAASNSDKSVLSLLTVDKPIATGARVS
ncbi:methionine--tRNA ligase [candidate division KSB1 bacterium]|nr:methionine--tRNA ligase [candidate division KSB1 bacterium]